jgi:hypothetical protein
LEFCVTHACFFWNDEEEVKARSRLSLTVGDAGFDERNVVVALQEDLMYHHTYGSCP